MAIPAESKNPGVWILLLVVAVFGRSVVAVTDPTEVQALLTFRSSLQDPNGNLASWTSGTDPCDTPWTGVFCEPENYPPNLVGSTYSHVTELRLLTLNLTGELVSEIGNLQAMYVFDVMWNYLTGSIPPSFGNLSNLYLLLLNGNQFTGVLPDELGNLKNLNRIQIDQNNISGPIPQSFGNLSNVMHLHMNNNSLNGSIPVELGNLPRVVHILLDNNNLTGTIPRELAFAPNILIIQLDNNPFDRTLNQIPAEYTTIPTLLKLSLRNCGLQGIMPNFNGSGNMTLLDLSINNLTGPILGLPPNVTSVDLSNNQLSGLIPDSVGGLQALQFLELSNNQLNGSVPVSLGSGASFQTNASTPGTAVILDFQNNSVSLPNGSPLASLQGEGTVKVWLAGNAEACGDSGSSNNPLCVPASVDDAQNLQYGVTQNGSSSTGSCSPCNEPYVLAPTDDASNCRCANPITVLYRLKSPSITLFDLYEEQFRYFVSQGTHTDEDDVQIRDYENQVGPRIQTTLLIFPAAPAANFNQSAIDQIDFIFTNWQIPDDPRFGPTELIQFIPPGALFSTSKRGLSAGAIAGIVVASIVMAAIVAAAVMFLYLRRRGWDPGAANRKMVLTKKGLKRIIAVTGVTAFTYEEMVKATDKFSEKNVLGRGGYGKVYYGVLESGQKVAVKRAEEGSVQGVNEFENEIQLLSRVHHRNLLSLIGYCNDDGEHSQVEQMLVYEYISKGDLRDNLQASSKVLPLSTRLRIALGSARGIHYLHTQADPPIFHRDIKASNILLDDKYNAKVADFGLSKLAPSSVDFEGANTGHVSTLVKGTPGYLDPEYFLTHQLTDKSDVYSFGIVLLELITGLMPISHGKNIAREVKAKFRGGAGLHQIVDPTLGTYPADTMSAFTKLALSCCEAETLDRPSMTEVVHELEEIYKETTFSDAGSHSFAGGSIDLGADSMPLRSPLSMDMSSTSNTTNFTDSSGPSLMSRTITNFAPR